MEDWFFTNIYPYIQSVTDFVVDTATSVVDSVENAYSFCVFIYNVINFF